MTTAPVPRPAPAVDSSDDDEEDDDVFFDAAEDFSEEYGPPRALPSSGKSGDSLTVRPAGRGALGMPGRHSAPPPQQPPSSYRPQPAPRPKVNPPRPQPTPQAEQQQPELKPRPAPQLPPRTASPGAPPLVKQESFSDKLLASMQVSRSASPRSADDMITATLVETGPLAPPTPARAPDRAAAGSPDSSSAPAGSKNSMIKPVASPVAATATSAPARPVAQPNRVPPVPPRLPPRPSIVQQQGAPGDAPALPPRLPPRPSLSRPVPPPRPSSSEPEPEAEEPHVFRDAEMTPMMIKNLDTGEMCYIDQAPAVFQEVAKAEHAGMTLDQFDRSAAGSKREQAGRTGRNGRMSADDASLPSESAEETKEKKKAIGVMANIRRLLRNSLKQSNASDNNIKVKVHGKRLKELTKLRLIQEVFDHAGPVWTAKFSHDGFFLATGGQDSIVRIWAVAGSPAAQEMMANGGRPVSDDDEAAAAAADGAAPDGGPGDDAPEGADEEGEGQVEGSTGESGDTTTPLEDLAKDIPAHLGGREFIMKRPYRMYSGHKNDVIDVSWSKANFLLSASIDRTVRLWHVTRQQCLRVFVHNDFVTSVAFHPVEDRFFVSGSFDKKLRIWSVVEHCVVEWAPAASVITGVSFSPSGDQVVAGLYNGLCVFYQTEGLKYYTQVECRNRSGKFKAGTKVTGVEFSPNGRHLLVTTNDSRIRLFSVDDFSCLAKFKGLRNLELQIRARFSEDGRSVLCGSDNNLVHLWDVTTGVQDDSNAGKVKMDRNDRYEYFKAHATTVTTAQFVPRASIIISSPEQRPDQVKHLIVSSDYNGKIKIFENTGEPELKS